MDLLMISWFGSPFSSWFGCLVRVVWMEGDESVVVAPTCGCHHR